MMRRGSLAPIVGRTGLNAWLYRRWVYRGNALYTALGSLLTIALSGLLAWGAITDGFTAQRVACVALSLAFTGGILRLLRAAHPPAGATTVIVAIGLLTTWDELLVLAAGVALLALSAWALNRVLGVPAPIWSTPR